MAESGVPSGHSILKSRSPPSLGQTRSSSHSSRASGASFCQTCWPIYEIVTRLGAVVKASASGIFTGVPVAAADVGASRWTGRVICQSTGASPSRMRKVRRARWMGEPRILFQCVHNRFHVVLEHTLDGAGVAGAETIGIQFSAEDRAGFARDLLDH